MIIAAGASNCKPVHKACILPVSQQNQVDKVTIAGFRYYGAGIVYELSTILAVKCHDFVTGIKFSTLQINRIHQ